jgi:Zn ribbon nucleic-acid-binding protein
MVHLMAGSGTMEIAQQDVARYRVAWSAYVRRRNLLALVFLGYIPWGIVMLFAMKLGMPQRAAWILILVWFVMFPVAAIRFSFWSCPRCHKPFYSKWWYSNHFARKCVYCGLSRKEIKSAAQTGIERA